MAKWSFFLKILRPNFLNNFLLTFFYVFCAQLKDGTWKCYWKPNTSVLFLYHEFFNYSTLDWTWPDADTTYLLFNMPQVCWLLWQRPYNTSLLLYSDKVILKLAFTTTFTLKYTAHIQIFYPFSNNFTIFSGVHKYV